MSSPLTAWLERPSLALRALLATPTTRMLADPNSHETGVLLGPGVPADGLRLWNPLVAHDPETGARLSERRPVKPSQMEWRHDRLRDRRAARGSQPSPSSGDTTLGWTSALM